MSLLFRSARSDDLAAAAELAGHSFPGVPRTLEEWEGELASSPRGDLDALWIGQRAGRMAGMCLLFPLSQWIGGERFPVMGLGTVAISPTERRRGVAGEMIVAGFRHAIERGDVASALYPFRTRFYRKLGYGMAGEAQQYIFPPAALPDDERRSEVVLVDSEDARAAVARIYREWAPARTGQLTRDGREWEIVWRGDARGVVYRGEGGGYAIFRYDTGTPRTVVVDEIAWTSAAARAALHGWLASLSDQWERIVYPAHPEEGFGERLRELRHGEITAPRWHFWFPAAVMLRGPMFRLLDLERAWSGRPVAPGEPFELALEVRDDHLPGNDGNWRLRLEGGRVEVRRGDAGARAPDLRLTMPIETLSRLFIGDLTPSMAVTAGLATADRTDRLTRLDPLLHLPRPWMFDRF